MIDRLLVLCTVSADGLSRNGFRWPLATGAVAQCPDWDPNPHRYCGGGLHGLPWGIGDGGLLTWDHDNRWLIVDVDLAGGIIGSADKCRFRRCTIMHVGDRYSATEYLIAQGGDRSKILGAIATAGDNGTATAGYGGTATAGHRGTATAGDRGMATAGDNGTATAGYGGTATAGDNGTATAGHGGTATAGHGGTATAGHRGTATAGHRGTATAGDRGMATAGDNGTATAGYGGTATAGDNGTATAGHGGTATAGHGGTATAGRGGTLAIRWWDNHRARNRIVSADVGDNGIKPNVPYIVRNGKLVRKDEL